MECDKINNLLSSLELSEDNEMSEQLSKFVTRQYVKVNSLSNTYNENKPIRFKTPMLRSSLCDYSDAYILVKGTATVTGNEPRGRQNRPLILTNNAPFVSFMTKINNEFIEYADDLDIVMPMYNLLENRKNYRKTIGSLYNYYRDELSDDNDNDNFGNIKVVNSEAFKYKNKIIGNMCNVNSTRVAAAGGREPNPDYRANLSGTSNLILGIPLKYLGNFWRALNIPLISCEVPLELKWNKNCVITSIQREINLDGGNTDAPTGATLAINDCKLYVPVVTLSNVDEIKLLTNLKSGFKREIIWNKYRSQMTTKAINNNLNILIDPAFTNVNRLFVLAYRQDNNDRQSFSEFYLPNVMVKDYNVIIDKLAFFDLPIKTEEEAYEKIIDIGRNNEYTTGNLLDYDYFKKHYKLIAIGLSKQQLLQENEDVIQQINFIGRLENAANVFIIIEKKENTVLEFSQNFANVIY